MRCLYCGKHLPFLRKLTGGGEFCSDAHRDKYHEEYNRLAVSRLVDARAKPEESKPAVGEIGGGAEASGGEARPSRAAPRPVQPTAKREAPADARSRQQPAAKAVQTAAKAPTNVRPAKETPVTETVAAAVDAPAEQDFAGAPGGVEAAPSSYVDKFAPSDLRPLRFEMPGEFAVELSPVMPVARALAYWPSNSAAGRAIGGFARTQVRGYIILRPGARAAAFSPAQTGDVVDAAAAASGPAIPAFGHDGFHARLPTASAVVAGVRPAPCAMTVKPLEAGVRAHEIASGKPQYSSSALCASAPKLSRAGPLPMEMGSAAASGAGVPEMAAALEFAWLAALRAAFDNGLQLLDDPGETSAELTPRVVLAALSHAQGSQAQGSQARARMPVETKQTPAPAAPEPRPLRSLAAAAAAPGPAALAAGFDSVRWRSNPALLACDIAPFRPKMTVGPPPGPARKDHGGGSRISPRSMLQLEGEAREEMPEDLEGGSVLGKLGGLFGKRRKNGQ